MNPMQVVNQLVTSPWLKNNPMASNVMKMIQSGDIKGIEQFGRNIAKERGLDFDQQFNEFKQRFRY